MPYLAAARWHVGHGSIGRRLPERPILQMTIVFINDRYLCIRRRSECSAVPALPTFSFSRTFQFLLWLFVTWPRMSPLASKAIADILYVHGLCEAFSFKSCSTANGTSAFLFPMMRQLYQKCCHLLTYIDKEQAGTQSSQLSARKLLLSRLLSINKRLALRSTNLGDVTAILSIETLM